MMVAAACGLDDGGLRMPTAPTAAPSPAPTPTPRPPSQAMREIRVGEEVTGVLTVHGAENLFELTAPADGALIARLTWDSSRGRLTLMLADTRFGPVPLDASLIVGTLPVVAGLRYRVRVADGAPWDYDDLFLPFTLTTFLEQ
jgi:hypothetical protein